MHRLSPALHLCTITSHMPSLVGYERLLCLHIHRLGQPLYRAPGAGEMRHKTTMSLPRGAGGMAVGLLSVCVLFDLNVFICLMPLTPYGEGAAQGEEGHANEPLTAGGPN